MNIFNGNKSTKLKINLVEKYINKEQNMERFTILRVILAQGPC